MNATELVGDPIFQLNLMLFLSWPAPSTGTITPVFANAGYTLFRIEARVPISESARIRLESVGVDFNPATAPDIMLEHELHQVFLTLECKKSSFSHNSNTANQARTLLTFHGQYLSKFIGKPPQQQWSSVLSYVTREGHGEQLIMTLRNLSQELQYYNVDCANIAGLELCVRDDGIYLELSLGSDSVPLLNLKGSSPIMLLAPDQDPRPLYLIPFIPGGTHEQDEYNEHVFRERLRASILTMFGSIGRTEMVYELDVVISRAVQVWKWWDESQKQSIRRYVREFLRSFFRELYVATNYRCNLNGRTIILPVAPRNIIQSVQRYLRSAAFRQRSLPLQGPFQETFDIDENAIH